MTTVEHPDVLDPDGYVDGVPHEALAAMRREAPVAFVEVPGTPGVWFVSRHEDVVAVSRDHQTYSSEQGNVLLDVAGGGPSGTLPMMDPPRHTRYRLLVSHGFLPRSVAALEARVRTLASRIVDEIAGSGECDFVPAVAAELSLQVIAELMGIPFEDRRRIFEWSNALGSLGVEDPEYCPTPEAMVEAGMAMYEYSSELAEQRRREPRDDIVTALLHAEVDGERLTESELNQFFLLLAVAGNETTRNTLSHGMLALTEHPEQRDALHGDPAGVTAAVDEILRWATPVMYFRRTATRDTEIREQRIAKGDWVVISYMSANRDEDVFAEPFRFDVTRSPNPHLAFGGGGPHFCLGAQLARLEVRVMFDELLRRLPDVHVCGDPVRLRSSFFNGVKHLPVAFSPR